VDGFEEMWARLLPLGRSPATGGYRRFSWSPADLECRAWFREQARVRDLAVRTDRNGNMWAWWGEPGPGAVVTGSHLDSVPDGGAFDGPLGVVSALAAIDVLRARGTRPVRPLAVAVFVEEEGARFGVPCLGSRLLTGAIPADRARRLADADGCTWADAFAAAGGDPDGIGPDEELLGQLGTFVELHVEQGRGLVHLGAPVGVASAIWPHGRWRFDVTGAADHAGTTPLADRRDPMLTVATMVLTARKKARLAGALATVGKVAVLPGGSNAIPSAVHAWLDARAPDEEVLRGTTEEIIRTVRERAVRDGTSVTVTRESYTPVVEFAGALRDRIARLLRGAPVLPTGAGHDAGVLAAAVPTAMLFVRNPTGVSHAPGERAELADCLAGVHALADVLTDLAC
jgi:beta-ureidopropionase / N-carbamoyl-L-amino-acid hydrolase